MNHNYILESDPWHGWLEVPLEDLQDLMVDRKISSYSYINKVKELVCLEEDCDLGKFVDAYKQEFGYPPAIKERYVENTKIRDMKSYNHTHYK
jgi:hypothetical protein